MKLVVQRVKKAKVIIDNKVYSEIKQGFLVYLGITHSDTFEDVIKYVNKVANLRVFEDENGKMNLSIDKINGEFLVVSQFTLYANSQRGNRPSFIEAANPDIAIPLYELFISELSKKHIVKSGQFGANMQIESINDGPVTIILEKL
ncbi:MAG TPA: D-tyrosyl-tRNA(Tyr) deacylase [Acholeplasma sp.]|nr:D-tyrosyl-tRNA(Tyr) deacylase [Acholeplasma sp.]